MTLYLLIFSIIVFTCVFLNRFSGKVGIPVLLFFLVLGLLCGSEYDEFAMERGWIVGDISTIALIFAIVDIGIFLFRSVLWQWLIKEVLWQWLVLQIFTECLLKEVFKSFVAKLLGYSVLFIFGFFVFWLIKSGKWVDLFDFCSGLWQ